MRNWRKILSWEVVPEGPQLPRNRTEALALKAQLNELARHGDASVHSYNVNWVGYVNGTSIVEARNLREAIALLDYDLDDSFEAGEMYDWESHGIECDATGEEESW